MKLRNVKDVENFQEVLKRCTGDVWLQSLEGDRLDLKSVFSRYIALGRLLEENDDNLELFASNREDEARLIQFLCSLN